MRDTEENPLTLQGLNENNHNVESTKNVGQSSFSNPIITITFEKLIFRTPIFQQISTNQNSSDNNLMKTVHAKPPVNLFSKNGSKTCLKFFRGINNKLLLFFSKNRSSIFQILTLAYIIHILMYRLS